MSDLNRPFLAWCVAGLYRLCSMTWRVRFVGRQVLDEALAQGPVVVALWHGEQAALLHAHRGLGIVGLASQSRDGDLLAKVIARLGYGVIRGSSSRGGVSAIRQALRAVASGASPALAIDGPRGPAGVPQLGALHLSARTSRPVVYMVSQVSHAIRLRTWDAFVVPLPFARIEIAYGLLAPPARDRSSVADAAERLKAHMGGLSAQFSRPSSPQPDAPVSAA